MYLLHGILWIGIAFAIFFTILRTTIRAQVFRTLSADDACVIFALIVLVAVGVLCTYATPGIYEIHLIGQPGSDEVLVSPDLTDQLNHFLKLQFAIIILFWTSIWAVKFSFLIFYKRLFASIPRTKHVFIWRFALFFTILAYVSCQVMNLKSCRPISNYFHLGTIISAVDVARDILILVLPLHSVWKLQITKKQKFALVVIFSVGTIIIIVAIVRVIEVSPKFDHVDPLWLSLWSMIEASVAVVVACLPSFHVFFKSRSSSAFNRRNLRFSPRRQQNMIRLTGGVPSSLNSARTVDLERLRMVAENPHRANSFTPYRNSREDGCRGGNGHVLPRILEHRSRVRNGVAIEPDASASNVSF